MSGTFKPRLTAPSTSNPFYLHTSSKHGLNDTLCVAYPSVLPNCVGYARGRFSEIAGKWIDPPCTDAGQLYQLAKSSGRYDTSAKCRPKLGAMICWALPGSWGHVAIVEKINKDGSIVISESGYRDVSFSSIVTSKGTYNSTAFWTSTRHPPNYYGGGYVFQGFIYNPYVDDDTTVDSSGVEDDSDVTISNSVSKLYDGLDLNDKKDAMVREIGYVNSKLEPSILPSDVRLSVVNYTSTLAALFNNFVKTTSNVVADTSSLDQKKRVVVDFFIGQGFPAAAGVGVLANIFAESSLNTASVGDYNDAGVPTSFGICGWHNSRGVAMKKYVGSNWANNLTGQLQFLLHELKTGYKSLLGDMKQVENTEKGACHIADRFVREFERPAFVDEQSKKRQQFAKEFWSKIVLTLK